MGKHKQLKENNLVCLSVAGSGTEISEGEELSAFKPKPNVPLHAGSPASLKELVRPPQSPEVSSD